MSYANYGPSKLNAGLFGFIAGALAWAMFGPKIKRRLDKSKAWHELKNEITEESRRVKDLTQSQYERLVDEVGLRYGKMRSITQNELKDLLADLKRHWIKIKDALSSDINRPSGPDTEDPGSRWQ